MIQTRSQGQAGSSDTKMNIPGESYPRLSEEDAASLEALGREGGTNVWQHGGSS